MIVQCRSCASKYNLDEGLLKSGGSKVRCSVCKNVFIAYPPEEVLIEEPATDMILEEGLAETLSLDSRTDFEEEEGRPPNAAGESNFDLAFEEAMDEINKGFGIFPESFLLLGLLGCVYAQKGDKDKTQEILDELLERSKKEYVSPSILASLYTDLGDVDKTYLYLEEAYEERDIFAFSFTYNHLNDPRFDTFFKKIGL